MRSYIRDDREDDDDNGYEDDSGEWVRRKATAAGHSDIYREHAPFGDCVEAMEKMSEQVENRYPPGCSIQLPSKRIRVLNVVTARDGWTRVVRYHLKGVYNDCGTLKVHRMKVHNFFYMVRKAKAEDLET